MPVGDSLATSFNQDDAEKQRSTHAKIDETAESFKRKQLIDIDRIQHTKVGTTVAYTKGQGTIVKKDGAYVTIYNEEAGKYDTVHAGETYIPGDTISMGIMNQLWDQMTIETRTSLLHKHQIPSQFYVNKTWHDMPENIKEVLKLSPHYVSVGSKVVNPPKGAHQDAGSKKPTGKPKLGTEVDAGAHTATSGRSRTMTNPKQHYREFDGKKKPVTARGAANYDRNVPKELKDDPGFSPGRTVVNEKKSEIGSKNPFQVSGVTRDENFTKRVDREDPDSGGESFGTHSGSKKSDVEHGAYGGVITDTPFDATEDYEESCRKFDHQFQHEKLKEPKNMKEYEILTGKADEEVSKEGGGAVTTGTVGANNAVYNSEKEIKNKYNTRYGVRQASKEEIDRYLNK